MRVIIRQLQAELLHIKNCNQIRCNFLHNQFIVDDSSDFFGINEESQQPYREILTEQTLPGNSPEKTVQTSLNKHSTFQSHFGTIRIERISQLKQQIPLKNGAENSIPKTFLNSYVKLSDDKLVNDLSNSTDLSVDNLGTITRNKVKPKRMTNLKSESITVFCQANHKPFADKENKTFTTNKLSNTTLAQNKILPNVNNKMEFKKLKAIDILKDIRKNSLERSVDTSKSNQSERFVGIRELGFTKDAMGFNIFTNQVQNWNSIPCYQVVEELRKSIIYEDDNILGINKPYGLSVMGDNKNLYSIHSLGPNLAKVMRLKTDQLHIVHRLDKDCTGVLILAKNTVTQARVNEMFRQRLVQKVYWAITVGVPDRPEGIIDIPLVEREFNGIHKIFVAPVYDEMGRVIEQSKGPSLTPKSDAKTEYEITRRSCSAALLKLQTRTGFKHQIRVHLAYGLNCPILGDHKYSHLNLMKPQRLPSALLDKLHVRQAKVRTLPLHLHAFSLILPSLEGDPRKSRLSNTVEIAAPRLPFHFKTNMKCLGLSVSSKD